MIKTAIATLTDKNYYHVITHASKDNLPYASGKDIWEVHNENHNPSRHP